MLELEPVTGALGAIARGVDLGSADESMAADLRSALGRHLVLYFPDQELDRFQLSALGRLFGPPFLHPLVDNGFDDCPDVLELRREPDETLMFGGASWHADVTWLKPSGYLSILHAKTVPPVGGDTGFASTIACFEQLSSGLQDLLRGLKAVHSYFGPGAEEQARYLAMQPVVAKQLATGREGLYVNRMFTTRFEGMTEPESRPLLNYLFAQLERHEFTCRFRWQPGGTLMWDNRFTLHFPINDFSGQLRVMIRTTVLEPA
ncbi:MAG: TauD/TfdA family dioxygenase [Pseudomonadota bacterium]